MPWCWPRRLKEMIVVLSVSRSSSVLAWCRRLTYKVESVPVLTSCCRFLPMCASTGIPFSGGGQAAKGTSSCVEEVVGDLFTCPREAALAHCVSADLRMGKGIAVAFKKKFGGVDGLKAQDQTTGGMAVLRHEDRFVYYLVTKEKVHDKPTLESLNRSLKRMREHCEANGVNHVCMPRIGCGLDRLNWRDVKSMINRIFSPTRTKITVYQLPP